MCQDLLSRGLLKVLYSSKLIKHDSTSFIRGRSIYQTKCWDDQDSENSLNILTAWNFKMFLMQWHGDF